MLLVSIYSSCVCCYSKYMKNILDDYIRSKDSEESRIPKFTVMLPLTYSLVLFACLTTKWTLAYVLCGTIHLETI